MQKTKNKEKEQKRRQKLRWTFKEWTWTLKRWTFCGKRWTWTLKRWTWTWRGHDVDIRGRDVDTRGHTWTKGGQTLAIFGHKANITMGLAFVYFLPPFGGFDTSRTDDAIKCLLSYYYYCYLIITLQWSPTTMTTATQSHRHSPQKEWWKKGWGRQGSAGEGSEEPPMSVPTRSDLMATMEFILLLPSRFGRIFKALQFQKLTCLSICETSSISS